MTSAIQTVRLNNGLNVLAKMHCGELRSVIYVSSTQAARSAAKLRADGIPANVWRAHTPARGFYIAISTEAQS